MEKQVNLSKSIIGVAIVTVLLLMVPLVAMQVSNEVNWSATDFIIMGALIFSMGFSFVLVLRYATNMAYRIAMAMSFGTTFFMIWANLAVGLIGSGPNVGNLLYMGVIAVVIISNLRSHFQPAGMERAMYITAITVVLIAVIELFVGLGSNPDSSVKEIIAVNGFFTALYAISGSLFRFAAQEKSTEKSSA